MLSLLKSVINLFERILLKTVMHPLCPEALSNQFLKFSNIPTCLGTCSDFDTLADECLNYAHSEEIENTITNFNNLKQKDIFALSSENLEVLSCFGIAQTVRRPINLLDWGGG